MKRKKIAIIVLASILAVFLLVRCMPIHTRLSRGSVVYRNPYTGVEFEEELTDAEVAAVVKILNSNSRHLSFPSVPSCGGSWDIAIILDGTRYMLALDTCGTIYVGGILPYSSFWHIDISDVEQDVLEAIFTSRGGTFPCL